MRIVLVAFPVAEILHQLRRGVEDIRGRHEGPGLLCQPRRGVERRVDCDGLRRGCEVDDRLGDGEFSLGGSEALIHVPCRQSLVDGLRVGDGDILIGEPHQTSGDVEGVLSAVEHSCQPVQCGVGVGAAHGLMQRGDEVVMPLLPLVIDRCSLLNEIDQPRGVQCPGDGLELFDEVEQIPAIAVCHRHHRLPGLVVYRQRPPYGFFRTFDECGQSPLVEAFEDEHLTARQQRRIEFEARILRRRADEHDRSVLHVGQEGVLLSTVEAVDLINEQHRALSDLAPFGSRLEDLAKFSDARESGRQRLERQPGLIRQQTRDCGLPTARRPPQHHRDQSTFVDHPSDRCVRTEQVLLAHHIFESLRTQTVGEGTTTVIRFEQ